VTSQGVFGPNGMSFLVTMDDCFIGP
jgi:hypothetical protein